MKLITTLLWLFLATASMGLYAQSVPEIPDRRLGDIAMVTVNRWGQPIIIYNPDICRQMGPALCEFYKWHEYGHIMMGHTLVKKWPQVRELEADCWAAKNAPDYALKAAHQWFLSGGGSSPVHGFGPQRAERIVKCAGY